MAIKKGYKQTKKHKDKIVATRRKNMSYKANKGSMKNGMKPHNYIDGRSNLTTMIRIMKEYLKWRADVFKRDNYHCQECGEKGYLEAHHIIPFIKILRKFNVKSFEDARECKLLWDIGNGISYCKNCHIKLDEFRRGKYIKIMEKAISCND